MRPRVFPHSQLNQLSNLTTTHPVTVILPIYNESACIEQVFYTLLEFSQKDSSFNFILINDGSTDQTEQILENLLTFSKSPRIQLVSYPQRQGKGQAIKKGIEFAQTNYICFIDGDLAYSLDHLYPLVNSLEKFDIVIGCRNLELENFKRVNLTRKIAGLTFNWMTRKLLNLPFKDMQAGLKGFKRDVAKTLFTRQQLTGFAFDCELLYIAKKYNYTIGEIPAIVSPHHKTKQSKVNLIQDSVKMLINLFTIRINDILGYYE